MIEGFPASCQYNKTFHLEEALCLRRQGGKTSFQHVYQPYIPSSYLCAICFHHISSLPMNIFPGGFRCELKFSSLFSLADCGTSGFIYVYEHSGNLHQLPVRSSSAASLPGDPEMCRGQAEAGDGEPETGTGRTGVASYTHLASVLHPSFLCLPV